MGTAEIDEYHLIVKIHCMFNRAGLHIGVRHLLYAQKCFGRRGKDGSIVHVLPQHGRVATGRNARHSLGHGFAHTAHTRAEVDGQVIAHEFDFKQEDQVVYEDNGVKITSWPAIHSLDGSVSYRLEWNELSFVFGGDTRPNKWFIKYARDADFAIHECFPTPAGLASFNDWEMRPATFVSSYIHTPPEGFGKVMAEIKPRMAVAYHTVLLPDIQQGMLEGIRETYDGPLTIATDLMVWNVSKEAITTREAVFADRVTPPPTTQAYKKAPRSGEATMSKFIMDGVWAGFTPPPLPKE